MIVLSLEEFTTRRRTAQSDLEKRFAPVVERALGEGDWSEVVDEAKAIYPDLYFDESGERGVEMLASFEKNMLATLKKTKGSDETTVHRISAWLATRMLSEVTALSAQKDEEELFLEWVDMDDEKVRPTHREASGQQRPVGEKFDVGESKMSFPGDTSAAIDEWIECRCTIRPVLASESFVLVSPDPPWSEVLAISDKPWNGSASRFTDEQWRASCILHLADTLNKSDHKLPIKEPGGALSRSGVHAAASRFGSVQAPAEAKAKAKASLRGAYKTLGEEPPANIAASGDAVWHGNDRTEFPLGDTMKVDEREKKEPQAPTSQPAEREDPPSDQVPDGDAIDEEEKRKSVYSAVPWHGVIAPEGIKTGDKRKFLENSLRFAPLPLPLTWQKVSDEGHKGNVVVAKIERLMRVGNEMRGTGHFIANAEADESIGLIGEFGRFGVSLDADDSVMEYNEEEDCVEFADARIRAACIVPIPAFSDAWVSLGDAPEDFFDGGEEPQIDAPEDEQALVASLAPLFAETKIDIFKDLAPGKTEDGPGWLTHPIDTDRLRDYWVRGPGAAEIGWGTPGDFNRCRLAVAQYIKPQYLAGYCANRHYDALGFWPGRPVAGETEKFAFENMGLAEEAVAPAINLVAGAAKRAPAGWFKNPEFAIGDGRMVQDPEDGTWGCPVTITDDGQYFCHIAKWETCHIGFSGLCVTAPHSSTDYAGYLLGQVPLDDGTRAATGVISIGGGHAGDRLSARKAIAHYDSTSTAVADVTVGEDEFGIWAAGWVRPGATDEQVSALMASRISGDWRGDELIAALAVNVPGFGIKGRPRIAAAGGQQISLVAAGMVDPRPVEAGVDIAALAQAVVAEMAAADKRKRDLAALAEEFSSGLLV